MAFRSNYPFLKKHQKKELQKKQNMSKVDRLAGALMANIPLSDQVSIATGFGGDGLLQPDKPTHLLNTDQGPRTVHEGENVNIAPDGDFEVLTADQVGGQGNLQQMEQGGIQGFGCGKIKGYQTGKAFSKTPLSSKGFFGPPVRTNDPKKTPSGTQPPPSTQGALASTRTAASNLPALPPVTDPFGQDGSAQTTRTPMEQRNIFKARTGADPIQGGMTPHFADDPETGEAAQNAIRAASAATPKVFDMVKSGQQWDQMPARERQRLAGTLGMGANDLRNLFAETEEKVANFSRSLGDPKRPQTMQFHGQANTLGPRNKPPRTSGESTKGGIADVAPVEQTPLAIGSPKVAQTMTGDPTKSRIANLVRGGTTWDSMSMKDKQDLAMDLDIRSPNDLRNLFAQAESDAARTSQVGATEGVSTLAGPAPTGPPAGPPPTAETTGALPPGTISSQGGLGLLGQFARGQDPFAERTREREIARLKGEEAAGRGALEQEMTQLGLSPRESMTERAMAARQASATEAGLLGDLAQQEGTRAFQAALQLPSSELAQAKFEDSQQWNVYQQQIAAGDFAGAAQTFQGITGKEIDTTTMEADQKHLETIRAQQVETGDIALQNARQKLGDAKFESIRSRIAAGATKEAIGGELIALGYTPEEANALYDSMREASALGQTEFNRELGAIQTLLASPTPQNIANAATKLNALYPGLDIDFSQLINDANAIQFAKVHDEMGVRISENEKWSDIPEAVKDNWEATSGIPKEEIGKLYQAKNIGYIDSMREMFTNSDFYQKMSDADQEAFDTFFNASFETGEMWVEPVVDPVTGDITFVDPSAEETPGVADAEKKGFKTISTGTGQTVQVNPQTGEYINDSGEVIKFHPVDDAWDPRVSAAIDDPSVSSVFKSKVIEARKNDTKTELGKDNFGVLPTGEYSIAVEPKTSTKAGTINMSGFGNTESYIEQYDNFNNELVRLASEGVLTPENSVVYVNGKPYNVQFNDDGALRTGEAPVKVRAHYETSMGAIKNQAMIDFNTGEKLIKRGGDWESHGQFLEDPNRTFVALSSLDGLESTNTRQLFFYD